MPYLRSHTARSGPGDVFSAYPEIYRHWAQMGQHLINGPSPLSPAEREMIQALVAGAIDCRYACVAHTAAAVARGIAPGVVEQLVADVETAPLAAKLKPLLVCAKKLAAAPQEITQADADAIFAAGWDERAFHDAVALTARMTFMSRIILATASCRCRRNARRRRPSIAPRWDTWPIILGWLRRNSFPVASVSDAENAAGSPPAKVVMSCQGDKNGSPIAASRAARIDVRARSRLGRAAKPVSSLWPAPHSSFPFSNSLFRTVPVSAMPLSTKDVSGVEIRVARRSDLAAVAECEARGFGLPARPVVGDGTPSHALLLGQIEAGEVAVIARGGAVLGFISLATHYEHMFVAALAVLPEHQRRGLGSRLISYAEREAACRGLTFVSLAADGLNAAGMAFYRHHRYVETERHEAPNFCRVYFSKRVTSPECCGESGPAEAA